MISFKYQHRKANRVSLITLFSFSVLITEVNLCIVPESYCWHLLVVIISKHTDFGSSKQIILWLHDSLCSLSLPSPTLTSSSFLDPLISSVHPHMVVKFRLFQEHPCPSNTLKKPLLRRTSLLDVLSNGSLVSHSYLLKMN